MTTNQLSAEAQALKPFKQDFLHYAPRALKIRDKAGEIVPFRLNAAQAYIHKCLEDQRQATGKVRALILKGRQQGCSTYVEGRFYHKTSMSFGKYAYILTHTQDSTDALFDMTKRYHDNCPAALQPNTQAASAKELAFADLDSAFGVGTAGSRAVGRGRTIQYFHGSEAAFWPNADDHFAGIGQAVPNLAGTEIILESTANGVGNPFHGRWVDAEKGRGEYIAIFVPWFWQPEYRLATPAGFVLDAEEADYAERYGLDAEQAYWRRIKIRDDFRGDTSLFDQEYPATSALAFRRVSGNPLILPELIAKARENFRLGKVERGRGKIMGLDVAEYGDDDSVLTLREGRYVSPQWRWHGKGPMEVVGLVGRIADVEKPDMINVDCTGVGSGVADRLIELGYPVNRVHFGSKALEDQQYVLRRDEMWGEAEKWFRDEPNAIPDDDALEFDLTAPQYTYDSSRRLKLERKEDMKKRGISSPDGGDSLALTFAVPYTARATKLRDLERNRSWRVS